MSWRSAAACLGMDPEIWFWVGGKYANKAAADNEAKAICRTCPVIAECLADAGEWGIWGGRTEEERRQIRHNQRRRERNARQRAALGHVRQGHVALPSGQRNTQ